jgi:hypothetical protein
MSPPDETAARRIKALVAETDADPRAHFADPQGVADARDAPYEARLDLLQRWRRLEGDGAQEGDVAAAIRSLEAGAELEQDEPAQAPGTWGYGAPKPR